MDDDDLRFSALIERHKTIRLISCLAFGTMMIGIIAIAVVKILDKPWYDAVLYTVGGVCGAIIAQNGMFLLAVRVRFRSYNEGDRRRRLDLEAALAKREKEQRP
jgi:Fe-S oxidoreductase